MFFASACLEFLVFRIPFLARKVSCGVPTKKGEFVVFVAEFGKKVVGFAIVMHREWFIIAYLDYIQVK